MEKLLVESGIPLGKRIYQKHAKRKAVRVLAVLNDTTVVVSGIKIESGIPYPGSRGGIVHTPEYPFKKMNVGDSFLVKTPKDKSHVALQQKLSGAIRRFKDKQKKVGGYKNPWNIRTVIMKAEGGVRVWRLENS